MTHFELMDLISEAIHLGLYLYNMGLENKDEILVFLNSPINLEEGKKLIKKICAECNYDFPTFLEDNLLISSCVIFLSNVYYGEIKGETKKNQYAYLEECYLKE